MSGASSQPDAATDRDAESALARRGASYGGGIALSRILGLLRDILIARDLGTSVGASALVIAQTVPNLGRTLASDDIAQGVLVPVFRSAGVDSDEAMAGAAGLVTLAITAVMIAAAAGVVLFARPLVVALAPGLSQQSRDELVAPVMRIFSVMLAAGGIGTVSGALLVMRHRYFAAAIAVAASNVPIVALLAFDPRASIRLIAAAMVGGILLQAAMQRALGGRLDWTSASLRERRNWLVLRTTALLALPVAISLGMANISGVIDAAFCSLAGTSGPAAFDRAFRLVLVPYGIVALGISVASINAMVSEADNPTAFDSHMVRALRLQLALLLPAAVTLVAFARPIVVTLFAHGQFRVSSIDVTTRAVVGMGPVLPALGLSALGTRAWTTRQRPWTAAAAGCVGVLLNLGLDAVLVGPLGVAGVALATAAVHTLIGGTLLLAAASNRRKMVLSASEAVAWALVPTSAIIAPLILARTIGGSVSVGGALTLLAIGGTCGVVVTAISGSPEYRLLWSLVRRGSPRATM